MKNLFHPTKRFGLKKILAVVFVLMLVLTPLHQAHALAWFLPLVGISAGLSLFDYFTGGLGGKVLGAVAWFINLLKGVASAIMTLAGLVFDYALQLSINFDYDSIKAIETAWSVLRDTCNVIFIFMILYIAIDTILGTSSREMVRKLVFIVLIALVINFSLLATKVIIDTSNVAMLAIYNQVATAAQNDKISLSFTFLSALGLTDDVAKENREREDIEKGHIILVDTISIALFVVVAWVFLQASFLLIGRVVSFVLLMIFSPLAFIGLVVPYSGFKENTTDWWWKSLVSQAVFGPVFLFLFLVTLRFATDPNFSIKVTNTDHGIDVSGLINFAVIIGMIYTSLTIAKFLGGGIGKSALSWGNWATGLAAGKAAKIVGGGAAGALGFAGRNTFGRIASRAARSEGVQEKAGRSWLWEQGLKATRGLANRTYDFRNTDPARAAQGLGVDLGKGSNSTFETKLDTKTESRIKFGQSLDRSEDGRVAYARRQAKGPLTSGGSQKGFKNNWNTLAGALGRQNRLAAAKFLGEALGKANSAYEEADGKINRINEKITAGKALSTVESEYLREMTTPTTPGAPTELEKMKTKRDTLQLEWDTLGLEETKKQEY